MVEKLDPKEIVTLEELLMTNVYTQEALINLLEKKGIIDKKELLMEIKRLRIEQHVNSDK
jgi:hypothetical protein